MPLPVATRVVEIAIVVPPVGDGGTGTVTFWLPGPIRDASDNVILAAGSFVATLDANGEYDISLPVNDEVGMSPTGWAYAVTVKVGLWQARGSLAVPSGSGSIQFADAFTDDDQIVSGVTYATVGALANETAARIAGDATLAAEDVVLAQAIEDGLEARLTPGFWTGVAFQVLPNAHLYVGGSDPSADPALTDGDVWLTLAGSDPPFTIVNLQVRAGGQWATLALPQSAIDDLTDDLSDINDELAEKLDANLLVVLEEADPIPVGTPAGAVIIRYTPEA